MPVDPHLLAAYLAAAWVLILTPGPDTMFVLGQTLAGGARRGWAATLGIVTGAMGHVAAAACGLSALVAASPALFEAVRLLGAGYLLWLGLGALLAAWRGDGGAARPSAAAAAPARHAFLQGALTNLLNPKVGLFFLAFLPQFVDPARSPVWLQMLILGPLLPLMALPFFALLIAAAGRATQRLARTGGRAARWLEGAAGAVFVGLGLRLLLAEGQTSPG